MSALPSESPAATASDRLAARLGIAAEERALVLWAAACIGCVLAANYLARPLREEMGIQGGTVALPWLFSATLAGMVLLTPVIGALAARLPLARLVPVVFVAFALVLAGFWAALESTLPRPWVARALFVWISMFNLFSVALFWALVVDRFDAEQGKRLFGLVAAGGSAGALAGPLLVALLVEPLGITRIPLLAGGFLVLGAYCAMRLARLGGAHGAGAADLAQRLGGSAFAGMAAVLRSPYMAAIAAWIATNALLSTFLYVQQAKVVAAAITDPLARTQLFAGVDLVVNVLALAGQSLAAGRLMARVGVGRTLALVPLASLAGFVAFGLWPTLWVVAGVQILRRSCDFAFGRPAREVLYTVVPREQKYKAKPFIETVLSRAGDALGGALYAGLAAAGGAAAAAWIAVAASGAWTAGSLALGRAEARRAKEGG